MATTCTQNKDNRISKQVLHTNFLDEEILDTRRKDRPTAPKRI
jgi:hypothetical protein